MEKRRLEANLPSELCTRDDIHANYEKAKAQWIEVIKNG